MGPPVGARVWDREERDVLTGEEGEGIMKQHQRIRASPTPQNGPINKKIGAGSRNRAPAEPRNEPGFFFEKHSINIDTHTRTSTHPYEHTHAHPIPMSTSERLSQLDLEIHEVSHQERLAVDEDVTSH
jgi:hypothetical protein